MSLSSILSFALLQLLCVSEGQRSSCDLCDRHMACDCSGRGFSAVPVVSLGAVTLDLSSNDIAVVTGDDLQGHAPLRVLNLHGNRIEVISCEAFAPLEMLEVLDLSQNRLSTLNSTWFSALGSLHTLNLLDNPYRVLGSPPLFQGMSRLRRLGIGGAAFQELRRADLDGVRQMDELTLKANNLQRYEPGSLAYIWPLGRVLVNLSGPFLTRPDVAASLLGDVSYPDTQLVLSDLVLTTNRSVQPFYETTRRRVRSITFCNLSLSDDAIVDFLQVTNRAPLTSVAMEDVTLFGEGRWEKAAWTEHWSIDEFLLRDGKLQDTFRFSALLGLASLLSYPRKLSLIGSQVFAVPCHTSRLLVNLQFLDLSDNLMTDMALQEALCGGDTLEPTETLRDLRVLNVSGNPLKVLSALAGLVYLKLSKLTHLDVSRTGYSDMPASCSWPSTLRHLNLSWAKLTHAGPCLPVSLEVLDLSHNDLQALALTLPQLRELHLSGNKLLGLPAGWRFPNLHTLTIQSNTLNMFSGSDLRSYRRLQRLEAAHNKFVCSCGFVNLLQSLAGGAGGEGGAGKGGLTLSDGLESYVCDSPLHLQGQQVWKVSLGFADCHLVPFVAVMCAALLVTGVGLAVLLARLHAFWYVKMMYAWLRAKHRSTSRRRQRRREGGAAEPLFTYDAFVSYSERDARWVEDLLVPELEEPAGDGDGDDPRHPPAPLSLCYHRRDFLPGRWVVENITTAMESSRRTIFVLSRHFVSSDWCRHELHSSHLRLADGRAGSEEDVLVLLEPLGPEDIPKRFCRLRRLMGSNTYLEWPQEEERRKEFWRKLRMAVGRGDEE